MFIQSNKPLIVLVKKQINIYKTKNPSFLIKNELFEITKKMLYKKIFWFNQNNKTEQRKHIWNHWAIYICMLGLAVKEEP